MGVSRSAAPWWERMRSISLAELTASPFFPNYLELLSFRGSIWASSCPRNLKHRMRE